MTSKVAALYASHLGSSAVFVMRLLNYYKSEKTQRYGNHSFPFNSLPHHKILDLFKLKAFVDHILNIYQKIEICFRKVENFVAKGENAGYQYFLLFPQCVHYKAFALWSFKVESVW